MSCGPFNHNVEPIYLQFTSLLFLKGVKEVILLDHWLKIKFNFIVKEHTLFLQYIINRETWRPYDWVVSFLYLVHEFVSLLTLSKIMKIVLLDVPNHAQFKYLISALHRSRTQINEQELSKQAWTMSVYSDGRHDGSSKVKPKHLNHLLGIGCT